MKKIRRREREREREREGHIGKNVCLLEEIFRRRYGVFDTGMAKLSSTIWFTMDGRVIETRETQTQPQEQHTEMETVF